MIFNNPITIAYCRAEVVRLADGRIYRGPNCEGVACRQLIEDGEPPLRPVVFLRNGAPSLTGTLAAFAGRMWAGAERDPAHKPYRPHPRQNAVSRGTGGARNGPLAPGDAYPTRTPEAALAEGGA